MKFMTAVHSDVGIKKETNEDSVLVQIANTDYGEVCLAVVCDGMGGFAKGELASATLIRNFSNWFQNDFPYFLYKGIKPEELKSSLENLIFRVNNEISSFGTKNHVKLGTTVAALLIVGDMYYIIDVGDSRIYSITNTLTQITKDQTFVQREMDAGRMTIEQAKKDPQRNVLLQCVGASEVIEPDFHLGKLEANTIFLLCSDGFRHVISREEIYESLNPNHLKNEEDMKKQAVYLTDLNKYRRENDNISAVLIHVS
ncbi:MAG: protein phosphatase 2C domain-containing protein [Lachnospiraceae bacterium]